MKITNISRTLVAFNKIITLLMVLWFPVPLSAQSIKEKLSLSLEKARTIATEKNALINAGLLEKKINDAAIAEARLKRLPQVYADFNLQRNLILPVTPVPANIFDPSAPAGEFLPLRFATDWTSNTGVNASIDLFNPQKTEVINEARIKMKLAQLENSNTANSVQYDVSAAYLAAMISAEQLNLAIKDTLINADRLKLGQQQYEEGRMLLPTLNRIKSDRNTTLNSYEDAEKIYENSKSELLYTMGFDPEEEISIEFLDSLDGLLQTFLNKQDSEIAKSYTFEKLLQNEALLNSQIKTTLNGFLPSLTLKGYYGANYFDNNFAIFKSTNWNGNSFVNLGLRIPVLDGWERQKKIMQVKYQKQANQLRYENERMKNKLDYLSAQRDAIVFEKKYLRSRENFELALQNLKLAEQQFAEGRLTLNELNNVTYEYQKEKNNNLNMAYNFMLSKLTIEKLSKF